MSGGNNDALMRTGWAVGQRVAVDAIEPIGIPRGPKTGRCGHCDGLIASEKLFNGVVLTCMSCGREAS